MMVRMTAIKLEAVPEFKKELKALSKKYKHLEADFKNFQRVLEKTPINFGGVLYFVTYTLKH